MSGGSSVNFRAAPGTGWVGGDRFQKQRCAKRALCQEPGPWSGVELDDCSVTLFALRCADDLARRGTFKSPPLQKHWMKNQFWEPLPRHQGPFAKLICAPSKMPSWVSRDLQLTPAPRALDEKPILGTPLQTRGSLCQIDLCPIQNAVLGLAKPPNHPRFKSTG